LTKDIGKVFNVSGKTWAINHLLTSHCAWHTAGMSVSAFDVIWTISQNAECLGYDITQGKH